MPSPSLSEQYVRRPLAGSSSTDIHIEGVTTPAIGPTAAWWWHGSSVTPSPRSNSAAASCGSSTSPSSAAPPSSAPRIGPDAASQVIGGPACRKSPRPRPSRSPAGATSTSIACTPSTASTARALAAARSGSAATAARSSEVPSIGGCQSTRVTSAACASSASASSPAPTETTDGSLARSLTGSHPLRARWPPPAARPPAVRRARWSRRPVRPWRPAPRPGGTAPAGRRRCRCS